MDFANRGNRPAQQQQPQQQQSAPQMSSEPQFASSKPVEKSKKMSVNFGKLSSIFVLFGVAILSAVLIVGLVFGGKDEALKESDLVDTAKYQAVFLNSQDGQVYFGKLGIYNKDLYVLTDIYYVRVENPIQPEGTDKAASQQKISLAKLGNELHGPEDVMYVARDKVLYWENLKDDGQVVKAITEYKKNGSTDTTKTNTTTDTTDTTDTTTTP